MERSLFTRYLTPMLVALAVWAVAPTTTQAQQRRQTPMTLEALAARVQTLEDVQEISNVLIAYGRTLDSRDFRAYSALFAKDGSWSGGLGTVTGGPQAIHDFMTSRIGGGQRGNSARGAAPTGSPQPASAVGFGPTYHIMSSFDIRVNGDTATASSRWAFVTAMRGPGIQVAGRYEDTFVREDGVWKIKSRRALNDLTAPAAAAAATATPTQGTGAPANTR
jgi:hypothetical protein